MLKIIKVIGIKSIYVVFFGILSIIIIISFLNIFNRYYKTFSLDFELKSYLDSVSLDQVEVESAERVIKTLNSTDSITSAQDNLKNPFAQIISKVENLD